MAMPVVYTETLKECSQDGEENLNVNIAKLTANHIVRLGRAFFSFVVVVVSLFHFGRPGTHYID